MKTILLFLASVLCVHADTWTFHAAQTVNPVVTITQDGGWITHAGWYVINYQYGVNQYVNPTAFADKWTSEEQDWLGADPSTGFGIWNTIFQEFSGPTLTITQPPVDFWVEGPIPDYLGYADYGAIASGEYWIDIVPGGGDFRLSTSAPSDFGKWAWDGSINPNYVEPLLKGRSHGKKK
jgi:hypothetical protein